MSIYKLYKITFLNYIYYGSTKQYYLSNRQNRHNENLKYYPNQLLYKTAKNNNINKLYCELINTYDTLEELKEAENNCILNNKDLILLNQRKVIGTYDDIKKRVRDYQKTEKGKLTKAKANKKYHDKNKENLKENKKEYYKFKKSWGGLLLIDTNIFN